MREKIAGYPPNPKENAMDAEQINLIGTQLSDLGARTEDLRRYL